MPEICRFYGIVIRMYYNDHAPPHFHAEYAGREAIIDIRNMSLIEGKLPGRAMTMLLEWTGIHQDELLRDWNLSREMAPLEPINPLD